MSQGHRVTTRTDDVHVEVRLDGSTVADTRSPVLLEETGFPTRYYLPRSALTVDAEAMSMSTHCPFKGDASYWRVGEHDGIAWSYENPKPGAEQIAGHVCFAADRAEVLVDGARVS